VASIFTADFVSGLRSLIAQHHLLYAALPPQGPFLEALVEIAFRRAGWPEGAVVLTTPNSPQHDLLVGTTRISIKSETGKGTRRSHLTITKLCTTETGEWTSESLINHALSHLARYDHILMLRAIWTKGTIGYQLLEVPLPLLRSIGGLEVIEVGHRSGRRSLAGDLAEGGERIFHVHFDGADGKCQIQRLVVSRCHVLAEWDHPI
jgi:hypothetical protein